jgi:hypothetical protein
MLSVVMLSVVMLSVVMLSIIMLSVVMLSVVMLNVSWHCISVSVVSEEKFFPFLTTISDFAVQTPMSE